MVGQTSPLSIPLNVPLEWRERFLIKRFDEKDVEITLNERNIILVALRKGTRFIQVGKLTLMLNSIKSIDPYYPPYNIPPKPELKFKNVFDEKKKLYVQVEVEESRKKVELWEKFFSHNQLPGGVNV